MKSRAPQLSSENRFYKMLSPSGMKIQTLLRLCSYILALGTDLFSRKSSPEHE